MLKIQKITLLLVAVAFLLAASAFLGNAVAQKVTPKTPDNVALGEDEVNQMVLLMDTDKNGKISRQEFMNFMAAEFDRLDKDKSGELDQKS